VIVYSMSVAFMVLCCILVLGSENLLVAVQNI
jgi:hypothetical protein